MYRIVLFTLGALLRRLEALAVDNGGARLVVLLLGDPHLFEQGEGSENGSIQTEYLRSGGAMILVLMAEGARATNSLCMRSAMPGNMVVPPERMMLKYRSPRVSISHFMMEL